MRGTGPAGLLCSAGCCHNIAGSPCWARVGDQQLLFSHWTKVPLAQPAETTTVAADHSSFISENLCALCEIPPNYRHNSICYGAHKFLCDRCRSNSQRLPAKAQRPAVCRQRHELLAGTNWHRTPATLRTAITLFPITPMSG